MCPSLSGAGFEMLIEAENTPANPVDRRSSFAICRCDRDIPAETNEIIEFQLVGQHSVELVIAKSPVGHNQNFDLRFLVPS
jgi:hypothetical protein